MTQATLHGNDTAVTAVLYMALELSKARWKVGFAHNGRRRRVSVEGGNLAELAEAIATAKAKFKLPETVAVRRAAVPAAIAAMSGTTAFPVSSLQSRPNPSADQFCERSHPLFIYQKFGQNILFSNIRN